MNFSTELGRSCYRPKQRPWLSSILWWFIGLWVEYEIGTRKEVLNQILQSSRSKSTTCLRKQRLLRFKFNSTATSDGRVQKLGNDVRHNSESIATKVCSQNYHKWNVVFESHLVTSVDRTSFDFRFEDFLSNMPLQTFIYCATDQKKSITQYWRSVLNFKFSVLTFLRLMSC